MNTKKISEQNLTSQCYDLIMSDIISNTLKPGEKLTIESIKKRFPGGQSPIREALSRLVLSGLVYAEDNKGFRVAEVTESEVHDIYETFTLIETNALRLSIMRGDSAWEGDVVAELHKLGIVEKSKDTVSLKSWTKQNYRFHFALIAGCQSQLLLSIREHLYLRFERYLNLSFQFREKLLSHNFEEHKRIAQYSIDRDADAAEKLMTLHINGSREQIVAVLKKNKII